MAKKLNEERSRALNFQVEESYKKARTNLVYSLIKKGCKKILFTSPLKGEGKTTTTVNVSKALAQQVNTKVVIVDCDLRRPSVHTHFDVTPKLGLAHFLNNECSVEDIITHTNLDNLDIISFGVIPPNPSELLSSTGMAELIAELEEMYDYIIFDTPPVNVVVDVLPIAKLADGVVLVITHNKSTTTEFNKAVSVLKRNESKILGVIVNKASSVDTSKGSYYKGY